MCKRVLILSASAGSGHTAAAQALEQAFRAAPGVAEVLHRDALELTSDTLQKIYADLFLGLVKTTPHLVGWWYDQSDLPGATDRLRRWIDQLNAEPLIGFIAEFQPDIIVCTHYMPASIVADLIARDACPATLSIVTTDYDFHSMWLVPCFHRYFVPLEETRAHLISLGLPEAQVTVSGIPVNPKLTEPMAHAAILEQFKLRGELPILLLSAGTVGGGPIAAIIEQLLRLEHEVQTVVICGKNEALRRTVERMVAPQAERFRVLGYTEKMPELMRIATLFIGKPGGLTSAEAMAAGLPMVIGMPIPGQEERNSDHLLEKGAAIRFNDLTVLAHKLDVLLGDSARLDQMRANTHLLAQPEAARRIVEATLTETCTSHCILDTQALKQMRAIVQGSAQPAIEPAQGEQVTLFESSTGVPLGAISDAQFQRLQRALGVDEDAISHEVTGAQVQALRSYGTDPGLTQILEELVERTGGAQIRWARG